MGGGGTRVTVDLTKENGTADTTHQEDTTEQQEKRTPNQLQKSIERYLTLSNKQGSNQSVEEGLTHTSKDKGHAEGADEKKREQARPGRGAGKRWERGGRERALRCPRLEEEQDEEFGEAGGIVEGGEHSSAGSVEADAGGVRCAGGAGEAWWGVGAAGAVGDEASRALDHKRLSFVVELAKEHASMSREIKTRQLQEDAPRLGTLSVQRKGIDVQEVWENGAAILKLGESYKDLQRQREQIDALRKATKRRLPLPGQAVPPRMDETMESISETGPIHPDDWLVQEEVGDEFCCFCRRGWTSRRLTS